MTTNADMTIYNQHLNAETKEVEYIPTVVSGVHWHSNLKVSVGENGLKGVSGISAAEVYKIRIPESAETEEKKYIEPRAYRHLPADESGQYWTIQKGDMFCKGATDMTLAELKKSADFGTVLGIGDNRRGMNPHFRIGGA